VDPDLLPSGPRLAGLHPNSSKLTRTPQPANPASERHLPHPEEFRKVESSGPRYQKIRIPTGESWWGFSFYDLPLCLCQVLRQLLLPISSPPPSFSSIS